MALLLGGLGLVSLPGLLRPLGRRLDPRDWAQMSAAAIAAGLGGFELGLLLYAAPTVLPAIRAFGLASICERMFGGVAPGGPLAGWAAASLAIVVAGSAGLSMTKGRRARRGARVEPGLGEHSSLGRHELVVLACERAVALSVDFHGGQVVVSSGLAGSLRADELEMVLAHETAHLDYHHQRYLSLASALRHALAFFPPARRSVVALVVALERWADEAAAASVEDGRDRLRRALRHVTVLMIGPQVAAFSAAETLEERLTALDEPPPGLAAGSRGVLYGPGFALGAASVAGLGAWVANLGMLVAMAGRCPL
ncbi:MAG: M56 family metallopeptidase [Acidimicrobiales bacterium]